MDCGSTGILPAARGDASFPPPSKEDLWVYHPRTPLVTTMHTVKQEKAFQNQ